MKGNCNKEREIRKRQTKVFYSIKYASFFLYNIIYFYKHFRRCEIKMNFNLLIDTFLIRYCMIFHWLLSFIYDQTKFLRINMNSNHRSSSTLVFKYSVHLDFTIKPTLNVSFNLRPSFILIFITEPEQ